MTRKATWDRLIKLGIVKGAMPDGQWKLEALNLLGVKLNRANLNDVNLGSTYLEKASLKRAKLKRAMICEATLREADLFEADLSGASLDRANLDLANFIKANLSSACLRGASVFKAKLQGANLREADLSEADLSEANFKKANLIGADLSEADLRKADLRKADLGEADLSKANLIGADFSEADLSGADITYANKSGWIIKGVKCTRVIDGEPITFKDEDGFEKKYTYLQNIVSLSLKMSLNGLSFITGQIVEQALNDSGDHNVKIRSVTAVSDDSVAIEYISFGDKEERNKTIQQLAIIEKKVDKIIGSLSASDEEDIGEIISAKSKVKLPVPLLSYFYDINADAVGYHLVKYYSQLPSPVRKIIDAVQTAFNK